jgi:hypothetical protein
MKQKFLVLLAISLLGVAIAMPASATNRASEVTQWDFDVYLNNKKVGKHLFRVSEAGAMKQVQSEARFKYTVLLIPAYRYEHVAAERWSGQCLVEIDAKTNANGDRIEISGEKTGSGFRLESKASPAELPECVMTFAYWNPEFLEQSRLLNPQTGEYVDVTVEEIGDEMLEVRGESIPATRFRLTADEIDITLWYSPDDEWVALESVAKGGHIIRYELS